MKRTIYLISFLTLLFNCALAQCNPYFDYAEGVTFETVSYDSKGKVEMRFIRTIKSMKQTDTGWTGIMHALIYDGKGKESLNKDIKIECVNGTMSEDMSRYLPAEVASSDKITITSKNLEYPANLTTSSVLPEASLKIETPILDMLIEIKNRKVIGKSTVTTKSGTYECIKVQCTIRVKALLTNKETTEIEYIAKDLGVVKSESLDKKGKVESYSELVKVTRK